jgi:hypothetical protein
LDLKFKEESSKVLHLERSSYGGETWTLPTVDQKYLESFEMWFHGAGEGWRRSVGPIV